MKNLRNYIVDKDTVYRNYKWKPEDGDYEPDVSVSRHKGGKSVIGKLVNLLISVFVFREMHGNRS